jgi:hypothetical protein
MIAKIERKRLEDLFDEKQEQDLAGGIVASWSISFIVLFALNILDKGGIIDGTIFLPILFFQSLLTFSFFTLYYNKKF